MAYIEISGLEETLNLDSDSVFPVVFQAQTKKVTFETLAEVLNYFTSISYNATTGVFTFTRVDGTSATLSSGLQTSIKDVSLSNGVLTFTKQDNTTFTIDCGGQRFITSTEIERLAGLDDEFDTLNGVIKQKIFHFDNVATMKSCLTLVAGDVVETLGYYAVNDGGGATYQIVNDNSLVDDGGSVHDLTNGLKAKLIIKDRINVKQFGAKGDGVADDTTAIETAFNLQKNLTVNYNQYVGTYENHIFPKIFNVYFPRGQYIYNGDGIEINDYGHLICIGESKMSVSIYIVKDIVLFYSNNHVDYLELRNIGFSGGNGVFNQRYNTNTEETPPSNITDKFVIDNCSFRGYKKCCIGSNFFDSPFWYINNNYFIGTTTSIAIAMPGDSAGSIISNNSFELDKYHLKLQDGGRGIVISNNDFIRVADTNEALHDIWILPAYPDGNQSLNYSQGNKCIITKNKFGGEKTKIR